MKKVFLAAFFMLALNVMAHAQLPQKSPDKRAGRLTKELERILNLRADQIPQINTALLTQATRLDSLRNNTSVDKKESRLTAQTILLSTQKQILAVLDDSQKQQFTAWENSKLEQRKNKRAAKVINNNPSN
jgi:hypothetical protein